MTFEKVLETARERAAKADISGIKFIAVQINVTGEGSGVFYVEVKDGKISVEPYEYNDRNCDITISSDNLIKLFNGKFDPIAAFNAGEIKVNGNLGKALEFSNFIKKNK